MSRSGRPGLGPSLTHFWKSHLAVAAGAAVAAAVLTGALLVGDSVRASLRDLALDRLGSIEGVLITQRPFRQELAGDLSPGGEGEGLVVPALVAQGSAVASETGARASGVAVLGVEDSFSALWPEAEPLDLSRGEGQIFPSVVVNRALAEELGVAPGDEVVLSFGRLSALSQETLVGREDPGDGVETLRLTVASVVPDRPGPGGFGLAAGQLTPKNAFVELPRLQRTLFGRGSGDRERVNGLLFAAQPDGPAEASGDGPGDGPGVGSGNDGPGTVGALETAWAEALAGAVTLDDLGVLVRRSAGDPASGVAPHLAVESHGFLLEDVLVEETLAAAEELGASALPVLTYLANEMTLAGPLPEGAEAERSVPYSSVPYSSVAALEPPGEGAAPAGPFVLLDGRPAPALEPGEILVSSWAAEDLGLADWGLEELGIDAASIRPTDGPPEIALTYYAVGPRDELVTRQETFRLRGVVALRGMAADPLLTPEFPGIQDADDMAAWDPPFPVDLSRVRPKDEAYWDTYRGTPKAFVSLEQGRELWGSRFGVTTSVQIAPASDAPAGDGADLDRLETALRERLEARLDPADFDLTVRPVRSEALEAARGATDFAGLFIGFSFFLIVSAVLLVALLFRLGVELRAREVGLLLAVGVPRRRVRRRLLAEGALVAGLGVLVGLAGAVAYAGAMIRGLTTRWLPAVGEPILDLHVEPLTLLYGGLLALGVVVVTILRTTTRLSRLPAPVLLAGGTELGRPARRRRRARWIALAALAGAVLTLAVAFRAPGSLGLAESLAASVLAFASGTFLLVAGLAAFAGWLAGSGGSRTLGPGLGGGWASLGARSSARALGRSLLAVALVASACFVIVAVGANRGHGEVPVEDPSSGAGGFPLLAEADVPLHQDLNRPEVRADLGLAPDGMDRLDGVEVVPLRLLPGEDASCLNLYRPQTPRVLGAPRELIERGAFSFQGTLEEAGEDGSNPWRLLDADLGPGVIPAIGDAASVQWILHKKLGDDLIYLDDRGDPVRLRLVGLLSAGSLFQSELLIAEDRFEEAFPSHTGYRVFLLDAPEERVPSVTRALEEELAPYGFDVTGTGERIAAFQAVENTYLATFQTLGGLGLGLGTLGLGVILLRSVLERRRELAALRAMGFPRKALSVMVVAETAFLLLAGVGIGTLAALVAVAPHLLEGGTSPPWLSLTLTLLLVILTGLAASLVAVAAVARLPLLASLKTE